ncbi:F-box/kelch-repeat protein SKIP25 [Silene latifolia]|uniref:F-box/kelch-repeat protein SKIP25 n=1 Tax=Silene latifolia TaxID=37657 RepID=UPI003D77414B
MSRKRPKLHQNVHHQHEHKHDHDHDHDHKHNQEEEKEDDDEQQLIPGLPDHIAHLFLTKIHPKFLYPVCPSWRNFIYSPLFPPFLSLYTIFTPISIPSTSQHVTPIHFSAFDPISSRWRDLPPPPDPPLQLLLRHPSFISRNLPIQSVAVRDRLILVAATTQHLLPALPRPLVFDPLSRSGQHWGFGPDIPVPRRWCAAGALRGEVYLASGVGSHFSSDIARAVEKWDIPADGDSGRWRKVRQLYDGRFSRESVEAVGWRGKLCMVNVKGDAAKQGAVYDEEKDEWREMSEGMVSGWRGPAAAMEEDVIYVVDVSKGVLRRYDEVRDVWVVVVENVRLRGAKQMSARGGRVCVVCRDGVEIFIVDVVAAPVRFWVVQPPSGFNAVAVHVLPRMSGVTNKVDLVE